MKQSKRQKNYWPLLLSACLIGGCTSSNLKEDAKENNKNTITFHKHIVHKEFISEGVAVGDVNQDGHKDILAGFYWFEAPDWTPHEIKEPQTYDYAQGYSPSFLNFVMDVNYDGWLDFIIIDTPGEGAYWYENPRGEDVHWKEHLIDTNVCNESPMLVDLDDNGQMDLVFGHEKSGILFWFRSPEKGASLDWEPIPISTKNAPGTKRYDHGLGFGDVNNDGRKDIIIRQGWWEAPLDRKQVPWTFHEANLGEPCSQMYAYDFDADGDQDMLSASAHAYGIWWHEKKETGFAQHLIDSSFSQTHGVAFADINADDLPDFVTGKRYFAHLGKDPGGLEPAVLYWFELQRKENNQPHWVSHLIDDQSGVGLQVVVEDLNDDGKLDIISSNKKGVHCFLQE